MFLDRVIRFGGTLGDQVKGHLPKKLESLIDVTNVVHVKNTCSKLHYDPYPISVACSYTEFSISERFGTLGRG